MNPELLLELIEKGETMDIEFKGEERNALGDNDLVQERAEELAMNQNGKKRRIYGGFTVKSVISRICGKERRVLSAQNLLTNSDRTTVRHASRLSPWDVAAPPPTGLSAREAQAGEDARSYELFLVPHPPRVLALKMDSHGKRIKCRIKNRNPLTLSALLNFAKRIKKNKTATMPETKRSFFSMLAFISTNSNGELWSIYGCFMVATINYG